MGDRVRILVVNNDTGEALLLERLCRAILASRLEHIAIADSVLGAAAQLAEVAFDVVLLDPQLLPSDGLDLLSTRTECAFQTIIVSARTDLALRAFDYGVLDFVPKPISRERLARALRRVAPRSPSNPFLAVRRLGRIDLIAVDDLIYVEGADKYSELVLANGQRNFYDKCLGRLEATLPRSFVRIHKSFLVRFNMVSRLHVLKGSRYFAELKDGTRLPVGRSRYERVKARLIWPRQLRG
jgi:DNA-binding LytR/AlgR family response regulator